jgi:alpha-L-fucosidase
MDKLQTPGDTTWFEKDRFGMFIHWGLYSLASNHEWVMMSRTMTNAEYERKYFQRFDPDLYDPEKWAAAASRAGMKYFVITTKHHEGFCLWDSALTDYKAPKAPCGRDLLRPMVDAFRARNMRVGLYHSLLDWHHEQYIVDTANHPLRRGTLEELNRGRDQMRYADYLHGQVRELLTQYGKVDILWLDFSFAKKDAREDFTRGKGREAWRSEELYKLVRELQPQVILNDRLDLDSGWDVKTPEQFQPRSCLTVDGKKVVWEACQTLSPSGWCYSRADQEWRSTRQLIFTLIDCVSKAGNLLLNVGPTGRGALDERVLDRLGGIGKWMEFHGRSIYGCTEAPPEFKTPQNCLLTYNPEKKRLYVHVLEWPYKHLHLDGKAYVDRVEYAQTLHDAAELGIQGQEGVQAHAALNSGFDTKETLTLQLPQVSPSVEIPVIELFLK